MRASRGKKPPASSCRRELGLLANSASPCLRGQRLVFKKIRRAERHEIRTPTAGIKPDDSRSIELLILEQIAFEKSQLFKGSFCRKTRFSAESTPLRAAPHRVRRQSMLTLKCSGRHPPPTPLSIRTAFFHKP